MKPVFRIVPLIVCLVVMQAGFSRVAHAQKQEVNNSAADAAYQGHHWFDAENLYSALTRQQPDNARYWYRLAVCERANQKKDAALESFQKAKALGAGKGLPGFLADYEIATTYAAMGNPAQAFKSLKDSADAGFQQINRLDSDPEWTAFRKEDAFVALAKEVRHNAAPCEDEEFRQFDFWLGDWDVTSTADGSQQGTSHISKEMGGCVLWENWTAGGGINFGKSYNTYNINLHRWEQYWVDNTAGTIFFYGNLKNGVMDYWTDDVPQVNGTSLRRHLQFFNLPEGKVRQFSQGSTDGGKTWNVEYDLTYSKHGTTSTGPASK
jgi:tetratricopeptide (TPR) repeat protein